MLYRPVVLYCQMKLRIRENSIRLRLTRSEVTVIRDEGLLQSFLAFPDGKRFEYALESSPASVAPNAQYTDDAMLIRLPESTVREWADSDQVAIASEQAVDNDGVLSILVEKDFACLSPREGEDESDMFAHPEAGQRNC